MRRGRDLSDSAICYDSRRADCRLRMSVCVQNTFTTVIPIPSVCFVSSLWQSSFSLGRRRRIGYEFVTVRAYVRMHSSKSCERSGAMFKDRQTREISLRFWTTPIQWSGSSGSDIFTHTHAKTRCRHHSAMTNCLLLHFAVYSRLNFEFCARAYGSSIARSWLFLTVGVGEHNFNYYYYIYLHTAVYGHIYRLI